MSRTNNKKTVKNKKLPPFEKVVGITIDNKNKLIMTFTDDMLINQIKRDSGKISLSFDKLCDKHIKEISRMVSISSMISYRGIVKAHGETDELRVICVEMLSNATNSLIAATILLRNGFRLQPGILIRSILETISSVLHLFINQGDLKKFQMGRLDSSKTINAAKELLPPFGMLYGFFSKEFIHIGNLHQNLQPITEYKTFDEALESNISFLRLASWLLYVTVELVCLNVVDQPRYWQFLGEKKEGSFFAYNPSEKERSWLKNYLKIDHDLNIPYYEKSNKNEEHS